MNSQKKSIEEVREEYNKLHQIPVDVTDSVTHSDFVAGVKDGTVGFKVVRGEASALVRGARKSVFNALVMLYFVAPAIAIPFWAYHERSWWLLLGIPIASLIAPQFAQRKGHSVGAILLVAFLGLWFSMGPHSHWAFFSLCAFWGYIFFRMADDAQTEYAMQSLVESSELFIKAVAEKRISVVRRRDS